MSSHNLIPGNNGLLNKKEKQLPTTIVSVRYRQIDNNHYGFYYDMDEDVEGSMEESNQTYEKSKFNSVKFDESITVSERYFYIAAAASGFMTGCMDSFGLTDLFITKLGEQSNKNKNLQQVVISIARMCGYEKENYTGAVNFLKSKAGFLQGFINAELSRTPNITGLMFSIIGQYTGELYSLNDRGEFNKSVIPGHYVIGRNDAEKIMYGFLYWLFHMAVRFARKKQAQLSDEIPQEIWSLIETFGYLPIFRYIDVSNPEIEKRFSDFLRKLFENANSLDGNQGESPFSLRRSIEGLDNKTKSQVTSVVLNECITRGLYTVISLCRAVHRQEIYTLEDLQQLDVSEVIPFNNRIVRRMCLISSGVFVSVNVTGAIVKALYRKTVKGRPFATSFAASVNIAGIGRFIFAIAQDAQYWGEDIKIIFNRAESFKNNGASAYEEIDLEEASRIYETLRLDSDQVRLLYSIENYAIKYDIEKTRKAEDARKKEDWYQIWKDELSQIKISNNESCLIDDESEIYRTLFQLEQSGKEKNWFYLIALELALFKPYIALNSSEDKNFAKLKREYDYVKDQYSLKQTIVREKQIDQIRNSFDKYKNIVNGSTFIKKVGTTAAVGTAAVAGVAAFTFAPAIAVSIAGTAFSGLHGAALTSASLAMLGGGSLAAGGFGMAGGTAVIAGGGALLGLTGTGTAAAIITVNIIPNEFRINTMAKLLAYADNVLLKEMHDRETVKILQGMFQKVVHSTEQQLKGLKSEKNDLDKETINNLEAYLKCARNTEKELGRMSKR